MNRELLERAMQYIRPEFLAEAAARKRQGWKWAGAAAAVLALVLLLQTVGFPLTLQVKAVSTARYPVYVAKNRSSELEPLDAQLDSFFTKSMTQTLSAHKGQNQAYSPVNLYMALAVLAELTGGNTRQQILDTLGQNDLALLRTQTNTIWKACYYDNKNQTLLANSLWLNQDLKYHKQTMDLLSSQYYTSVYQADFGSDATGNAIANWVDKQTEGLLQDCSQTIHPDANTVLAAYSTVFYRAKWNMGDEFYASKNTEGMFSTPTGPVACTFMNKKEENMTYYWGEDFGAVSLYLQDGSQMWLILPDAGKTLEDVLQTGEYLSLVLNGNPTQDTALNSAFVRVNLSVPKFDIQVSSDLKQDLQAMGIQDVFQDGSADFSASVESNLPVSLAAVNQATRVAIDEEGVTAASYIEEAAPGAAPPPDQIIDFILDRPFLFVITNPYQIPLFSGIVNTP